QMRQGHEGQRRTQSKRTQRKRAFSSVALVALCVLVTRNAAAQGRFVNARAETLSASAGLESAVRTVAARGAVTWIGYRAPTVAGQRNMCCYDTIADNTISGGQCRLESGSGVSMNTGDWRDRNGTRIALEPSTEFLVLARLENGSVSRVRTFTPDCDVDAGGMPVVWLGDAKAHHSVARPAPPGTPPPHARH